jgi:predicted SprT family Zn-dependent metalloprotease
MIFIGTNNIRVQDLVRSFHEEFASKARQDPQLSRVAGICDSVTVYLNGRMRSAAGKARFGRNQIEINIRLLENNEAAIRQTYGHELAHLLSFTLGKRKAHHGPSWRRTMKVLGLDPDTCHRLDASALTHKRQRFPVYCRCAVPLEVTARIIVNIAKNIKRYKCRKCKSRVSLTVLGSAGTATKRTRESLSGQSREQLIALLLRLAAE